MKRPDCDERLNHLHRVTTRKQQWPELCVFAFDHRKQLADMAREANVSEERIPVLKTLLLPLRLVAPLSAAGLRGNSGILADTTYDQAALNAITGQGWRIGRPVELPGSRPLPLEHGNIGSQLIDWPQVGALIDANDPFCRGVLILGQDASEETLKASFAAAAEARWVKGFVVGRTIFGQLSRRCLQGESWMMLL